MRAYKLLIFLSLIFCSCSFEKKEEGMKKKIAFIFSFTEHDVGYKQMLDMTLEQLSKKGITPETDLFFLDCEYRNDSEEQQAMKEHLDKLQAWKADIIMVCKDQATYALLKCGHPFTRKVPIVYTSVNYPNTALLDEYKDEAVYGLNDTPDMLHNIEFIQTLFGQPPHVTINYEINFLGRKSFDLLRKQVEAERIIILKSNVNNYMNKDNYDRVVPFLEENGHVVQRDFKKEFHKDWYIELLPFRYWGAMGIMTKFSNNALGNPTVFLLDKYDLMATSICRLFQIPVFSCVYNGFGENINIAGGYFASDKITAREWASRAYTLLKGEIPEGDRFMELPKEYLLDYLQFRRFSSLDLDRVPAHTTFINMPWHVRYRTFLYSLAGILAIGVIILIFVHFYLRRKVKKLVEHENKLIREKELAEEADRLKQSFLANMSHEIRTPLNAIVGFTNLLLDPEMSQTFEPDEKQQMIDTVNHNSELLLKLINDILEISRFESGYSQMTFESNDLVGVVKGIYNTHSVIIKKDLDFRLSIDDSHSIYVSMDKLRFIQVISNFLSNANKFTKQGSITLGIDLREEQQEVGVYVRDTGIGLSKKHQIAIFDRFYKADEFAQGTGLGLSICKIIMEKMGGRIDLDSEPGKGSCFTAVLPLNKQA